MGMRGPGIMSGDPQFLLPTQPDRSREGPIAQPRVDDINADIG